MIGGFVVLFSVIISIFNETKIINGFSFLVNPILKVLNISSDFAIPTLSGILELTNGVKLVSSIACKEISLNIILSAFLIGFSGLSVTLQVYSLISNTDLSIKPYILGKLLQGVLAALYTYIAILNIPFFNFNV